MGVSLFAVCLLTGMSRLGTVCRMRLRHCPLALLPGSNQVQKQCRSGASCCKLFAWNTVLPLNLRRELPLGSSLPFSTQISKTLPTWTFFPLRLALLGTSSHSRTDSLSHPGTFLTQIFPFSIKGFLGVWIGQCIYLILINGQVPFNLFPVLG